MMIPRLKSRRTLTVFLPLLLSVALIISACSHYAAENHPNRKYPEKPIQMIIVWSQGGGTDLAVRLIGEYAAKALGQPFIYKNITGANGAEGWSQAVKADADGYTVASLTFDILTNQAMNSDAVKYDDFDVLCQFTVQPIGVFVPADSPFSTLDELLDSAAEHPNDLTMATTPLGGFFHQGLTMLENASRGARFDVVPYKGSAEIIAALAGRKTDAGIQTLTGMEQYLKDGRLRLLAVFTEERLESLPEVPTARELGYDVIHKSWRGFAVPKGTPDEVKLILVDAFKKAFDDPEFREKAQKAKLDLVYAGPEDFKTSLDQQYPKVQMILKQLGFVQ